MVLLTEWDPSRNRSRFISTRDKLIQYPRILTGQEFPPLDENNCAELQFFVTVAKDFRDAIVHASASLDPKEDYPKKELLIAGIKHLEVAKIVDAAISLVRKIDMLVKGREPKWLHDREERGTFSDAVFE